MYKYISKDFEDLVLHVESYFDKSSKVMFNKRNILKLIQYNGKKYIVKRFKKPNFINQIIYKYFRKSKAKRSYENSLRLKHLGINTAKPIGYYEKDGFLFTSSYYISEYIAYDFEIRAVLSDPNFKDRDNILKQFVSFSYDLHSHGVFHIDYSPGNIIVQKNDDNYRFSLVDVNRMKFLDFDMDLRMKSMAKLTNREEDINFILKEYAIISNIGFEDLKEKLLLHVNKHQNYIKKKKRLKSYKGKI